MAAAFVVRDNVRQRRAIERAYVEAIRAARTRVDIAVPYFYPGRAFRRSLRQAARRGVQVRLLLQGKVDYRIAALAARALYDELRAHGVRIHEYTPAFLHAKVAVVDDDWATVGSSNIDPLSLLLNLEANVVVRDPDFNAGAGPALRRRPSPPRPRCRAGPPQRAGWRGRCSARWWRRWRPIYLRVAGITGRLLILGRRRAEAVGAAGAAHEAVVGQQPQHADHRQQQHQHPPARAVAVVPALGRDGHQRPGQQQADPFVDLLLAAPGDVEQGAQQQRHAQQRQHTVQPERGAPDAAARVQPQPPGRQRVVEQRHGRGAVRPQYPAAGPR
jgi:hypothetical protein